MVCYAESCTIATVELAVCLFICLSLRLSHVRWHCVKERQAEITKSAPKDSPRLYIHGKRKFHSELTQIVTPIVNFDLFLVVVDSQLNAYVLLHAFYVFLLRGKLRHLDL